MTHVSFKSMAEAVVAAYSGRDPAFHTRTQFWIALWDERDVATLTPEDVEDGIDILVKKPKAMTRTTRAGVISIPSPTQTISPATINRYVATLGTLFKEARRMRPLVKIKRACDVGSVSFAVGQVVEVSQEVFRALVRAGFAVPCGPDGRMVTANFSTSLEIHHK